MRVDELQRLQHLAKNATNPRESEVGPAKRPRQTAELVEVVLEQLGKWGNGETYLGDDKEMLFVVEVVVETKQMRRFAARQIIQIAQNTNLV